MTLADAIKAADAADKAFEAAIKAAGYNSRWEWSPTEDRRPVDAYTAKVEADGAVHKAFEASRNAACGRNK